MRVGRHAKTTAQHCGAACCCWTAQDAAANAGRLEHSDKHLASRPPDCEAWWQQRPCIPRLVVPAAHLALHQGPGNLGSGRRQPCPLVPNVAHLQALNLQRHSRQCRTIQALKPSPAGLQAPGSVCNLMAFETSRCKLRMAEGSPYCAGRQLWKVFQAVRTSTRWLVMSCRWRVTEPSLSRMTCSQASEAAGDVE